LFQDLIPGHDEGDPSKRLTRYKFYYICSFLCEYVIDYLESETEGHICMWIKDAAGGACGTSVVDVFDVGCMWDFCIGCTCYMDVCGTFCIGCTCYVDICATNALAVCALRFMWDYCIGCACYVDVCGATAHIVHARWMHMGPLHWLYVMWECTGYCQRMFYVRLLILFLLMFGNIIVLTTAMTGLYSST